MSMGWNNSYVPDLSSVAARMAQNDLRMQANQDLSFPDPINVNLVKPQPLEVFVNAKLDAERYLWTSEQQAAADLLLGGSSVLRPKIPFFSGPQSTISGPVQQLPMQAKGFTWLDQGNLGKRTNQHSAVLAKSPVFSWRPIDGGGTSSGGRGNPVGQGRGGGAGGQGGSGGSRGQKGKSNKELVRKFEHEPQHLANKLTANISELYDGWNHLAKVNYVNNKYFRTQTGSRFNQIKWQEWYARTERQLQQQARYGV